MIPSTLAVENTSQKRRCVSDVDWYEGGRRAILYFLTNYVETSREVFDNDTMPENLQYTYIKFQNDLKKESGTAIELLFTGKITCNYINGTNCSAPDAYFDKQYPFSDDRGQNI